MTTISPATPLFSAQWYRIEQLCPALAADIRITRHAIRGSDHIVLARDGRGDQMRLNESAWRLIGRCDGKTTLGLIWAALASASPDDLPSQHLLLPVLARLVRKGFLHCPDWPDEAMRRRERDHDERQARRQRLNPFAPRLRVGDPTRLIVRIAKWTHWLFSAVGIAALLSIAMLAAFVVWQHPVELAEATRDWMGSPRFWLITWMVFPAIKLIHEIAHGLVIHHYGGRTPEIGIALLMGMPAPYVDASAANLFASRVQRALVSAAGILAELAVAAIAIVAWSSLAPGLARDVAFVIALTGSVSTLAFNANPLVRLDGYYLLSDLMSLPNLATRSAQYWRLLVQRHALGLPSVAQPLARGERSWLLLYAPGAWCWRATILIWLAFWLGDHSRALGAAMLLLAVALLLVVPALQWIATIGAATDGLAISARLWARVGATLMGIAAVALVPLPDRALTLALVVPPEGVQVRATRAGFVESMTIANAGHVESGAPVLQLADPAIDSRMIEERTVIASLRNEWLGALTRDMAQARVLEERLAQASRHLVHLERDRQELQVLAPAAGRFDLAHLPEDLPDRYIEAGELIGFSAQTDQRVLHAALDEDQAARLRAMILSRDAARPMLFEVRDTAGGPPRPSHVRSLSPTALDALPSRALGTLAGGSIDTDTADANGMRPARPTWRLELALDGGPVPAPLLGTRYWVRLDYGWRPFGAQLIDAVARILDTKMAPGWV